MEGLVFLAIILLAGTLASVISVKLKMSNIFFLVFIGMLLEIFNIGSFPKEGIVVIAMISLVMVLFTSSVNFKINELLKYSRYAIRLSFIYLILTLSLLSIAA